MKPENTETRTLESEVKFDGKIVKKIKFDLKHINQGWDESKHDYKEGTRSNYKGENVEELFSQFDYYEIEWGSDKKKVVRIQGKAHHRYTTIITDPDDDDKELRIIIDVPVDFADEAVIVTIFEKGNS